MARDYPAETVVTVQKVETVPATTRRERTVRAIIESPRAGSNNIFVFREEMLLDADGNVLTSRSIAAPVHRLAQAVAEESVTLDDGTVITAAQIMAALPRFFDIWADEDIEAGRRG